MATIEVVQRFDGGFTWKHAGNGLLECRSHALRDDDGGVWLVDPLDGAGLDEELEQLGDVVGVIVLFDRHLRSSARLAERYGGRLLVPPGAWRWGSRMPDGAEPIAEHVARCPFEFVSLVQRDRQWLEWALWWQARRILVVPEAVGSAGWFLSRTREPLAVHPILRVVGPPRALTGLELGDEPSLLLLGHGDSIERSVYDTLDLAVTEARRELPWYLLTAPRHAIRWARAAVSAGRASC